MKIITKTTYVIGEGKTVGPGEVIDLNKDEAMSLIERGLADDAKPAQEEAKSNSDKTE